MIGTAILLSPSRSSFVCQVRAHTDAEKDHGYHLTAVTAPWPGGTWLEVDNFTGDAPQWWQIDTCDSTGSDPHCIFLGRPPGHEDHHPVIATMFEQLGWTAAPDATIADVVAHMQITSCYSGTASCPEPEQGAPGINLRGGAVFRTHLDFIQLDPRNGWPQRDRRRSQLRRGRRDSTARLAQRRQGAGCPPWGRAGKELGGRNPALPALTSRA